MKKKKICIISVSLAKGGLERFCANLSILLSDNGYDVHLVTLNDDIDYDYKGQLFNLGEFKSEPDTLIKRLLRFRRLRRFFRQNKFDYIIDNRIGNKLGRELYYMFYIYGFRSRVIYVQHSAELSNKFPKKGFFSSLIIKYSFAIVAVSNGVRDAFIERYETRKCIRIYNYIARITPCTSSLVLPDHYFLFLGRLDDISKNFSLLVDSFCESNVHPDYKLLIVGDGLDKQLLKDKIAAKSMEEDILLIPFQRNVYTLLSNAQSLLLTSNSEGFGRVLVESLSLGTPVISVDCNYGPREIVIHENNGLLIDADVESMASSIDRMVNDFELYEKCTNNSIVSIEKFNSELILKAWCDLLS